jgi:S-adenosylmethionine hydrolase
VLAPPPALSGDAGADPERRIVALLTDFGDNGFYVPALKGAIYAIDPHARVIDLTHQAPHFDIREAAFLLAESSREFPPGVVFIGVVDPGVGTSRKPVAIRTKDDSFFVGPDNGMLIEAAALRGIAEVREIRNPDYMRRGARSSTFHGRDIFGPAGASLAKGMSFENIGPKRASWVPIKRRAPSVSKGAAAGEVLHVDAYGNLLTNLTAGEMVGAGLAPGERLLVSVGKNFFEAPYQNTYGEVGPGERVVTIGSTGRVEIAINEGSLAKALGARADANVVLKSAAGATP